MSAHGLSDFLFECFDVFVAIGYNRVCLFNFVSFLARIEREFEVVRLGASELEIVDLVLHFLMLLLAECIFFLLFRLERKDFLIDIRTEFEFRGFVELLQNDVEKKFVKFCRSCNGIRKLVVIEDEFALRNEAV